MSDFTAVTQPSTDDPTEPRISWLITQVGGAGDPDVVLQGLDSLALVELVVNIETHFDLEIPDEVLTDAMFASVTDLTTAVDDLRRSR